ncbi:uncharacterized protein EV422DRAFT_413751 [Fimicolochytrium jonesii]|uniref:uncharacterized protein n=1 Tax=Fimicolochytrium jonesii TaxID=1396493 RepID=UPI0022FF0BBE|nr:uncharacterized protein EV422DRAFT_413751 [Fimicolochytrium jonesii]KAI8822021.1 hypothetical protein EV422DRAFT_413751 [Fimicolochytrium jonesii]
MSAQQPPAEPLTWGKAAQAAAQTSYPAEPFPGDMSTRPYSPTTANRPIFESRAPVSKPNAQSSSGSRQQRPTGLGPHPAGMKSQTFFKRPPATARAPRAKVDIGAVPPMAKEVREALGWGAVTHEKPVMAAWPPLPKDHVVPSIKTLWEEAVAQPEPVLGAHGKVVPGSGGLPTKGGTNGKTGTFEIGDFRPKTTSVPFPPVTARALRPNTTAVSRIVNGNVAINGKAATSGASQQPATGSRNSSPLPNAPARKASPSPNDRPPKPPSPQPTTRQTIATEIKTSATSSTKPVSNGASLQPATKSSSTADVNASSRRLDEAWGPNDFHAAAPINPTVTPKPREPVKITPVDNEVPVKLVPVTETKADTLPQQSGNSSKAKLDTPTVTAQPTASAAPAIPTPKKQPMPEVVYIEEDWDQDWHAIDNEPKTEVVEQRVPTQPVPTAPVKPSFDGEIIRVGNEFYEEDPGGFEVRRRVRAAAPKAKVEEADVGVDEAVAKMEGEEGEREPGAVGNTSKMAENPSKPTAKMSAKDEKLEERKSGEQQGEKSSAVQINEEKEAAGTDEPAKIATNDSIGMQATASAAEGDAQASLSACDPATVSSISRSAPVAPDAATHSSKPTKHKSLIRFRLTTTTPDPSDLSRQIPKENVFRVKSLDEKIVKEQFDAFCSEIQVDEADKEGSWGLLLKALEAKREKMGCGVVAGAYLGI